MKKCNSMLSIHEGMGTTQRDRVRPALHTDFFLLDERDETHFILFVQRLSKYVKFYNEFDTNESDWSAFFQNESTAILIYLSSWNIELLQSTFEIKKNEIFLNTDLSSQKNLLLDFFTQLENEFNDFLKRARKLDEEIIEKESLLSSSYLINVQFGSVFNQINSSTNMTSLLRNYVFIKTTQQLFGLLLSWKDFSQKAVSFQLESYSKHTPHYALFLTFLKLLKIAKEKFNEFTKQHLDFYYKDVLKIQNKNAQPDYVHLVAEPFKVKPFLIPKGTIFSAGENGVGENKFYAVTSDQTVNQIKLNSFLSDYSEANVLYKANSLFKINAKGKSFNVFTNNKETYKEGIMIASPLLFLQSGERIIKLRFNNSNLIADNFSFFITGEEKIIEITEKTNEDTFIKLTIPPSEKSIIPFNSELHPEFLVQSQFPVLKIISNTKSVISSINTIKIKIEVNQFKSFVLTSDFGAIDIEKPFYPFGELPKNGNGITISSNEFFMKKDAAATFEITSDSSSFLIKDKVRDMVKLFNLNNGKWNEVSNELQAIINNNPLQEYYFDELVTESIVSNGKFRIELYNSNYTGEKYLQDFIEASTTTKNTTTGTISTTSKQLPYKPRIKEFVFNYTVSETIDLTNIDIVNNPVEIFKIFPYGFAKQQAGVLYFSNLNANEGFIYLGFDTVSPQDGLNFLIQLEDGTANPLLEPASISWQYLSDNKWIELNQNAIGDETYSLTQSGLVAVTVPEFNAIKNTMLPSNLFWLRISVSNIQAICKFFGVHVQAFKAVLFDFEKAGTVFLENTPKETITKSYKAINGIKKVVQPYTSFLGRVTESDETLYTRTSERLRHKNKAITTWDYERIVLEEFPEVYRLKVLNHYRYNTAISNVSAGYVTLIPIAKASANENITWKPLLSLNKMQLIREHLYKKASPHIRINVKPPRLEEVKIYCDVKFHFVQGMDTRLYIEKLRNILNQYLSPWAYEEEDAIHFAHEIEFSSIIQLLDNQSYVDYITNFKVEQYQLGENNEVIGRAIQNLSNISPQSDFTLFIPTTNHAITEIE